MRPGQTTLPAAAAAAATALLFLLSGLALTSGCNKALCASDVSKCLIQVKDARPLRLQISMRSANEHKSLTLVFLLSFSSLIVPLSCSTCGSNSLPSLLL